MQTKDSRPAKFREQQAVRRRRRCAACTYAMTTYEVLDTALIDAEAQLRQMMKVLRGAYDEMGVLIAIYDATCHEVSESTDA
jgi:transcriptional regulator NrdR family protein